MADFKQYDPGQVVVNFAGVDLVGFMDGTFVEAMRSSDAFKKKVGAGGDVTRTRNRDKSGEVKVTLMGASPSNDQLSALAALDELFGTGTGPLLVKDLLGATVIEAEVAWIRKVPDVSFADDESGREWMFDCAEIYMVVGGSTVGA